MLTRAEIRWKTFELNRCDVRSCSALVSSALTDVFGAFGSIFFFSLTCLSP